MADFTKARLINLFTTPFMAMVLPDVGELNSELSQRIFAHAAATEGRSRSNAGGWHSEPGQLEFCGEAGRTLMRHGYAMADEATRRVLAELGQPLRPVRWSLRAWVNVNRAGDFNRLHTHPGSTWSGTYYVDTGDPPPDAEHGTPILLFDPCQGRANTFLQPMIPLAFPVRPEPGLMILFPSYLPHMVHPHKGNRPRMSIAFNLRKEPYP
jgi:uncharacterized protein (TIGR02466 family)